MQIEVRVMCGIYRGLMWIMSTFVCICCCRSMANVPGRVNEISYWPDATTWPEPTESLSICPAPHDFIIVVCSTNNISSVWLALILSMFDVTIGQWPVASVHSPNVHLLWLQIVFVVKLGYNMAKTVWLSGLFAERCNGNPPNCTTVLL